MQIKLTKVNRLTKDKEGNALVNKNGKPYTRLLINCNEYGERAMSGFDNATTANWAVGDTVDVEISEVKKGENVYLNFKPTGIQKQDDLGKVMVELARINGKLDLIAKAVVKDDYPEQTEEPTF